MRGKIVWNYHAFGRGLACGWAGRLLAATMVWCVLLFVAGVGSAAGHVIHRFEEQIINVPEMPGVSVPGRLGQVSQMAVAGGGLWVAEPGRVDEFNAATGGFIMQLVGSGAGGVAVAEPAKEAQVLVGEGKGNVRVYCVEAKSWCGVWTGADTIAKRLDVEGMAVDGSGAVGDWASGDVYVADAADSVVDLIAPQAGGAESPPVCEIHGGLAGTPGWSPWRVAVDPENGDVVVADANEHDGGRVDVFEPEAGLPCVYKFMGAWTGPPGGEFGTTYGLAAGPSGEVYVAQEELPQNVVDEFSIADNGIRDDFQYVTQLAGTGKKGARGFFDQPRSVAVAPASAGAAAGRVFVGDERLQETMGEETPGVVDVFSAGLVVPDVVTGVASGVGASGAVVNGSVNPDGEGEASCSFVWGETPTFGDETKCMPEKVANQPETDPPVAVKTMLGTVKAGEPGHLEPDTKYFYRLLASNANGVDPGEEPTAECEGVVESYGCFRTLGPGLHGTWSSGVATASATLNARIDPHGDPTSYFFEYAGEAEYRVGASEPYAAGRRVPSAAESIGAGEADVNVSDVAESLLPDTVYHYRIVAVSEVEKGVSEEFTGPEQTFTTRPAAGSTPGLLDGRAYELVTPPDKHGALIFALNQAHASIQAAADGSGIAYEAIAPITGQAQGYSEYEQQLSRRNADGGWCTSSLSPVLGVPSGTGPGVPEFMIFSTDLQNAVVEQRVDDLTLLSPEASEPSPYLSSGDPCGGASESFQPLLTAKEPFADVPAGTHFGTEFAKKGLDTWVAAGTPDLQHVIIRTSVTLTKTDTKSVGELYEWSAARPPGERLQLVSVQPGPAGSEEPFTNGAGDVGGEAAVDVGSNGPHAVSNDGTRVYWTSSDQQLYLSDTVTRETSQISGGKHEEKQIFQWASPSVEGPSRVSRVLFTEEGELYECEIVVVSGKDVCENPITKANGAADLTPPSGEEENAEVQKAILGYGEGEHGAFVYFVADGTLGQEHAVHGTCHFLAAAGSRCNVFAYHEGTVHFIGTISQADETNWIGQSSGSHLGIQTAGVSPDGRFLVFMSREPLTGYDNTSTLTGERMSEVFLYDGVTGGLRCVSCNPSGERPTGGSSIPGWTKIGPFGEALVRSRYLDDSGRLFFDSEDALVSQDINGSGDVYEFEPAGVGGCGVGSGFYSARADGCVGLVSSGVTEGESRFMDASESGDDVFFLTAGKLVPGDTDTALDIYDAHVCSARVPCASEPPLAAECATADSCRPAPSAAPEVFGAPASATFAGPGNSVSPPAKLQTKKAGRKLSRKSRLARALKACRDKRAGGPPRARCERAARRRYGARSSRRVWWGGSNG